MVKAQIAMLIQITGVVGRNLRSTINFPEHPIRGTSFFLLHDTW